MAAAPYCILVHPPRDSDDVKRLGRVCRERADDAGYRVKTLRSRSLRVVGTSGRRMNVLAPGDASNLYRTLHRAPSLVVALASALVSLDPSRDPPNRRETRSLEAFLAYKAIYGLVRGDVDAIPLFEAFEGWQSSVSCNGAGDPRVLPLHVFDAGSDIQDLDSQAGTEWFHSAFGGPSRREDGSGRVWEKGPAHGREALQVAGCALPAGMHWDVSVKRNRCLVANAHEVWRVQGGGYLNVYPDEHIRGPRSSHRSAVRRVWPSGHKKCPSKKKGH